MTDRFHSAVVAESAAGRASPPPDLWLMQPRTVYWLSAACTLLIVLRIILTEGGPSTVLLATFVCAALGALIVLATRRLLVAAAVMLAHVLVVSLASWMKLKYMNMVLHAYDLVFYLTSGSTLIFLLDHYRWQSLAAVAAVLISAAACALAYRVDPVRVSRRTAGMALLVSAAGVTLTGMSVGERRHSQFEYDAMHLSSFYRSWSETAETFWRGQLIEAAAEFNGPPLRAAQSCEPGQKPPHIILVHHESVAPPSLFKQLEYDRGLDRFFRSDNGESYKLRVETYGGASVLTEFSVMTGLSTYAFGGMRQFVQRLMSGRIMETVPKILTKCGYRNVLFYPMLKSFTSADRFFKGVGIDEIFDARDQKAKRSSERDRFYYDNALQELERHIAGSDKPLFTFIETMATHWPYEQPFEPHLNVPGGNRETHPELHEYLRRLWIAKLDYDHLRGELERRFPSERFLIVRYGDHQPMATRVLLGYGDDTEAEDVRLDRNSLGFMTFFAINGVNFAPDRFVSPPVLDVPYLGTVLLEAAGLPLSDAYKKRQKLRDVCQGRSFDCPQRELILSFYRQLLDAGLVAAR